MLLRRRPLDQQLKRYQKDFHKIWIFNTLLLACSLASTPHLRKSLGGGFGLIALIGIAQALTLRGAGSSWIRAHGFVHPVTYGEQLPWPFGRTVLAKPGTGARPAAKLFYPLSYLRALILNQTRGAFSWPCGRIYGFYAGWIKLFAGGSGGTGSRGGERRSP